MKKFFSLVFLLLMLATASCSSEMPAIPERDGSPANNHRSLTVRQVYNRLKSVMENLPSSKTETRSSGTAVDSIIAIPGGEVIGVADPTIDDLLASDRVEDIDTVST